MAGRVIIGLGAAGVLWVLILVGQTAYEDVVSERRCYSAGYPKMIRTGPYSRYCTRRMNNSDEVVPVGEVTNATPR